jgi:glycosyltransferase involved in cell wall biosynthesis
MSETEAETKVETESKDEAKEVVGAQRVREVKLTNQVDIPKGERSTISLHLMVKNGAGVVGRLMDSVGPYVDELVAILNDCEDDTEAVLAGKCRQYGVAFVPVPVTRKTHPQFYILDEEASYKVGRPLSLESFGGPFTNEPILADWSAARNVGWSKCTGKWKLFLDADDVVLDPECLPGLVKVLEAEGVELACSEYRYGVDLEGRPFASSFRERLALSGSRIRWSKPIHECLFGSTRVAHVRGNLVVRDMRDNAGKDVRIPGRNFKILYHRARSKDWEISPRLVADLIQEVRPMAVAPNMMLFAESLLEKYLEEATWPEERGWVYAMVSEMRERVGDLDGAIRGYEDSLAVHPGSKTAFRLCRATFKKACAVKEEVQKASDQEIDDPVSDGYKAKLVALEKLWTEVIASYQQGVANKSRHQALDDGPLFEEMEAIHAAGAYLELGQPKEALELAEKAHAAFPENSALKVMVDEIRKQVG